MVLHLPFSLCSFVASTCYQVDDRKIVWFLFLDQECDWAACRALQQFSSFDQTESESETLTNTNVTAGHLPRWFHWIRVHPYASPRECSQDSTYQWPCHRECLVKLLANDRIDFGCIDKATKRETQWNFRSNRMIKNHTRWPIWHELPKSTILIADLLGLTKRMFSGFRSRRMTKSFPRTTTRCHLPQWRTLRSGWERNRSAERSCSANFRVRFNETPRKFVLRNRSYRLYDNNSKTRHRWFRKVKFRFNFTRKRTHPELSSRVWRSHSNSPI